MTSEPRIGRADWTLIERSLTLPERATLFRQCPDAFIPDASRAAEVAARWRHVLGRSAEASIDDRLADLGIAPESLPAVVGRVSETASSAVPPAPWMEVCAEVRAWRGSFDESGLPFAAYLDRSADRDGRADGDDAEEPIPFEHALVPWVDVATRRLLGHRPEIGRALSPGLLRGEQRRLLGNLASMVRFAAIEDLERRRLGLYSGNDFALGLLLKSPPRTAYIATVRSMIGESAGAWMVRHAALARLLGVRVVAWVRMLAEFVDRLEGDREPIAETFGGGEDPGALTRLRFGSGDGHNGGRSVAVCTFERGLELVYKPRNCRIDVAFAEIVAEIGRGLDADLRLRLPRTLDRGTWGWAEFIEPVPCADVEGLRRYHRRMGVLLATIHALQGNDFHLENVMACGDHPVAIDLETVSVPRFAETAAAGVDPTSTLVDRSVLRTLLLPSVMGLRGQAIRNLGAIRLEVGEGATRSFRRLKAVNTDFQKWVRSSDPDAGTRAESAAWIETGETLAVDAQHAAVEQGYRAGYRAILDRAADWSGPDSPIRHLEAVRVRVLNRATNVYVRLIGQSCETPNLADGVERWLALERASIVIGDHETAEERSSLVAFSRAEVAAMLDGDVPYFTARADGHVVETIDAESGEPVPLTGIRMATSAVESATEQIGRMGAEDLALQLRLMGDSYRGAVLSLSRVFHGSGGATSSERTESPSSDRDLRTLAVEALEGIAAQAIEVSDRINWIDLAFDPQLESIRPSSLDCGIYSGRGGLALLFERAFRILGDRRWLELASRSIAREIEAFGKSSLRASLLRTPPAGMATRGGLMAAAWAIGRHEGCGRHREIARELAVSISARTIESDDAFDAIAGSAGFVLLLLRMIEEEAIPGADAVIGRLADHLVAAARPIDGVGWVPAFTAIPLCGFGHGRAGIALALLEAGRHLDRTDLRELGLRAFEAEHRLRGDRPADTWPDFRGLRRDERSRARFGAARWCVGSEGVALSRARALRIADEPFLQDDLAFALETVRDSGAAGRDHICCGRGGRLLSQFTLRRLGVVDGLPVAATIASGVAGLLDPLGSLDPAAGVTVDPARGGGPHVVGVGLFQGVGGLAWTALSLLEDDGSDLLLLRP